MRIGRLTARRYVARISNPAKRSYAERYYRAWLRGGETAAEAQPHDDLSWMAAQAVRNEIIDYLGFDDVAAYARMLAR